MSIDIMSCHRPCYTHTAAGRRPPVVSIRRRKDTKRGRPQGVKLRIIAGARFRRLLKTPALSPGGQTRRRTMQKGKIAVSSRVTIRH